MNTFKLFLLISIATIPSYINCCGGCASSDNDKALDASFEGLTSFLKKVRDETRSDKTAETLKPGQEKPSSPKATAAAATAKPQTAPQSTVQKSPANK